jgi:hypothetical protein
MGEDVQLEIPDEDEIEIEDDETILEHLLLILKNE